MPTDAPDALAEAPRILPGLDDVNRPFWTGGARGELMIQRCGGCGRFVHPPVSECPDCGGELRAEPVSGRGTVFTFTVNRHPFNPEVPLPYVIAIVELVEQADLRVVTNLVDCDPESVEIGMPVRVAFEDRGEIFVPVFVPDPDARD
ncbi:MAG TPA: Zn-ribbon domain-containing OB-fold protein [Acidimicrobiia bacterium]|nr:Zn-ribbon domain-containing OB-fold protein [Acidimicrobiia bacterium]